MFPLLLQTIITNQRPATGVITALTVVSFDVGQMRVTISTLLMLSTALLSAAAAAAEVVNDNLHLPRSDATDDGEADAACICGVRRVSELPNPRGRAYESR